MPEGPTQPTYGPDGSSPPPPPPPRRRRAALWFNAASWPAAVVLLAASLAWTVSSTSYVADLAANLGAQFLALTLVCGVLWAWARRRALVVVALVAVASHTVVLTTMRAAIWPREARIARPLDSTETAADPSGVVRFFHYNAATKGRGDEIEQLMSADGADVISIVGPPVPEQARVIYGRHLADRYAGKLTREWQPGADGVATDVTAAYVVSRWPIEPWDTNGLGPDGAYLLAGVVERPGGRFGLISVHPRSPRSSYRWRRGNAIIEAVIATVEAMRQQGLEIVILTDLNSTPTGYRSRRLCAGGELRRAKPLFELAGTYPFQVSRVPAKDRSRVGSGVEAVETVEDVSAWFRGIWPASIAIDDALVSSGVEVVGWRALSRLVSEHRPVLVDLRIPLGRASEANSPGR